MIEIGRMDIRIKADSERTKKMIQMVLNAFKVLDYFDG